MPFTILLNWTLLTVAILLLTRSLLRALRHRKTTTEPTCPRCRYVVLGLVTPTCPECGADLRTTGIVPPQKLRPHFGRAFFFSLALGAGLFLITLLLNFLLLRHTVETGSLFSEQPANSPVLFILLHGSGFSATPSPDDLAFYAVGPPPRPGISATFSAGHDWAVTLPDGPRATLFFSHAVAEWTLTLPDGSTTRFPTLTAEQLTATFAAIKAPIAPQSADELLGLLSRAKDAATVDAFSPDPSPSHWISEGHTTSRSDAPPLLLLTLNAWLFAFLWSVTAPRVLLPRPIPIPVGAPFPDLQKIS